MPEEVLFEAEREQSTDEIAATLRTVADKLESGDELTLSAGSESVTVAVPDRPTFEIKVEREGRAPNTEQSVEFELEWDESDGTGGEVSVE